MNISKSISRSDHSHSTIIIKRVDAIAVAIPLAKSIKMAHATFTKAENLLVRIEAENGVVGWGEAASAPSLTGETWQGMVAVVRDYMAPHLIGQDARLRLRLMQSIMSAVYGATGSHSAVEMALIDLVAKTCRVPAALLLGGMFHDHVEPMWMLGGGTAAETADEARVKAVEGYRFFKLKAGMRPIREEIACAKSVREAVGDGVKLCVDANSGFTLAQASHYLAETEDVGISFLEQPFAPGDRAGLKAIVRETKIPICADQSVHSISDIADQAECGVRGIVLKLNKLAGIGASLRAAALCEERGLKVVVAAKVAESSIASAAIMHLACVLPSIEWGVSLTHGYLATDIVKNPLRVEHGRIQLPSAPGFGVDIDENAVETLRID